MDPHPIGLERGSDTGLRTSDPGGGSSPRDLFADLPAERHVPGATGEIRRQLLASGERLLVLDDDPTGSQSVNDVPVFTTWEADDLSAAASGADPVVFVLTNTRSLPRAEAVTRVGEVMTSLSRVGPEALQRTRLISRSDSTLRGHFPAETDELRRHGAGAAGPGAAVLLCPAFIEAGRVTLDDVHWTRVEDRFVPAAESEFARDRTFGYESSNLRDWVAEKSGGAIRRDDVASLSLAVIRLGGPSAVAEALVALRPGQTVVVNAASYADLEVVALGLADAEARGRGFVCRTGPSFVKVRGAVAPRGPLTAADLYPQGPREGHGLVVVGSHTALSSEQMRKAIAAGDLAVCELDVPTLLTGDDARTEEIERVTKATLQALQSSDALIYTSRALAATRDGQEALAASVRVSNALAQVVREVLGRHPLAWLVAKGGITSSDLATRGLGLRRARVLGQVFPGLISVWRPELSTTNTSGMPYVVFPGNVGDETALVGVLNTLRSGTTQEVSA